MQDAQTFSSHGEPHMAFYLHGTYTLLIFTQKVFLELLRSFLIVPFFSPNVFLLFLLCCFPLNRYVKLVIVFPQEKQATVNRSSVC